MVKIKRAHESFVVLDDKLLNPYYLKDRALSNGPRNQPTPKEVQFEPVVDHKRSKPFQQVNISRIRSPNIPFVGDSRNRKTPELLLKQVCFKIKLMLTK